MRASIFNDINAYNKIVINYSPKYLFFDNLVVVFDDYLFDHSKHIIIIYVDA